MFFWIVVLSCIAVICFTGIIAMSIRDDIRAKNLEREYYKRIDETSNRKRREYIEHLKKNKE